MAYLRFLDDAGNLQTKVLDSAQFVIGRAPTCQLSFESDMISREHARIDMEADGRYRVRDLGSRNKTFVNGELIRETLISSGAVVRVGDRIVEFVDDSAAPERIELDFLTPDAAEPPEPEWIKIKAPLSLTVPQLEVLSQILADQPLTARAEDAADAALGQIVLDVHAERGLIALRGEGKTELRPLAHRGLKKPPSGPMTPVSQSFLFAPVLQRVAGRYPQKAAAFERLESRSPGGFAQAGLAAPLTNRGEPIGVLYVDRPHAKKPFTAADVQYAAAAGAAVGALVGEAQRRLVRVAGREGATWMGAVRRLQTALTDRVVAGEGLDAIVKRYPGRLRCGDFGTVFPLDEQRCALAVIDGGGHGLSGIVQSAAMRTGIHAALSVSDDALMDPGAIFNALNRRLAGSPARQILPCVMVAIDLAAGKLAYVNAGGAPPLLMVAPGRLITLDQVSLILGVDGEYVYETTTVDLPETFRVAGYTDGLIEATSAAGEAFGEQRLHDILLEREAFASAQAAVTAIDTAWSAHMAGAQPEDDALVLVLARG